MKKVIDRTVYDTQTAEQIAEYTSAHNMTDFAYFEERLHRTKKGNWFLYGEGGPSSPYKEAVGDTTAGSQEIIPMDEDEVIEWLESRGLYDQLMAIFPDAIEEA